MTICKRVYYSGTVQGVGFRYTAQRLAARYAVAGFVRNLADGRVELVAEGEAEQVDGLLSAIAGRMERYVEQALIAEEKPNGLEGFGIRY